MKRSVQFAVTEEQRKDMDAYAEGKGFHNASNLARFATIQYMTRYPLPAQTAQNGSESIDKPNKGNGPGAAGRS